MKWALENPELAAATQIYSPEKKASPCLKGGLSGTHRGCHRGWTGRRYDGCVTRVTEDKKRKNRAEAMFEEDADQACFKTDEQ